MADIYFEIINNYIKRKPKFNIKNCNAQTPDKIEVPLSTIYCLVNEAWFAGRDAGYRMFTKGLARNIEDYENRCSITNKDGSLKDSYKR